VSGKIPFRFAGLPGTQAGVGRSGTKTLIADRPEGRAGGQGLGFNGGELLAAALGGCFWNDLHYAAERLGHPVTVKGVEVELVLDNVPPRVVAARIVASLGSDSDTNAQAIFDAACGDSTIANSLKTAIRIDFAREETT
jgi:organic hydroperoxide reductase OsmC/OhrA